MKTLQPRLNNIKVQDDIWVIGWRTLEKSIDADFYMLFLPGEVDVPLTKNGEIMLFTEIQISTFLEKYSLPVSNNPDTKLTCDVYKATQLIIHGDIDPCATILNVLNFLIDCKKVLKHPMSKPCQELIYEFADYLTFNRDLASYFQQNRMREDTLMALYSLFGLVIGGCRHAFHHNPDEILEMMINALEAGDI